MHAHKREYYILIVPSNQKNFLTMMLTLDISLMSHINMTHLLARFKSKGNRTNKPKVRITGLSHTLKNNTYLFVLIIFWEKKVMVHILYFSYCSWSLCLKKRHILYMQKHGNFVGKACIGHWRNLFNGCVGRFLEKSGWKVESRGPSLSRM